MDTQVAGMVGVLLLVANLWAVLSVATLPGRRSAKLAWAAAILGLPLVGVLLWLAFGARPTQAPAAG